jgi:hypothetical protein
LSTGAQQETGAGDLLEEAVKVFEAMKAKNWRKKRDVAAGFIRKTKEKVAVQDARRTGLVV